MGLKAVPPGPKGEALLQPLRDTWLALYGVCLPEHVPYLYEVAGSPDADEGRDVPGCCCWSGAGLVAVPGATGEEAVEAVGARACCRWVSFR